MLRALTLHQPWAYAVAHLNKRIENRSWRPPNHLLGQKRALAIHAGKQSYDLPELEVRIVNPLPNGEIYTSPPQLYRTELPRGCIVAVCTVRGSSDRAYDLCSELGLDQLQWFMPGSIGWVLDDVVVLDEPVPCRGRQRVWTVPDDVELLVRAQVDRKLACLEAS